jgi:hypothetical protein
VAPNIWRRISFPEAEQKYWKYCGANAGSLGLLYLLDLLGFLSFQRLSRSTGSIVVQMPGHLFIRFARVLEFQEAEQKYCS